MVQRFAAQENQIAVESRQDKYRQARSGNGRRDAGDDAGEIKGNGTLNVEAPPSRIFLGCRGACAFLRYH